MLFHFLNFSQSVVFMFVHKTIHKVTNLKVHSKGRYFVFLFIPFQELQQALDYKVVFLTSQIVNPAYWNICSHK